MTLKIGIDFGGVLSMHGESNTDGSEHKSTVLNIDGAIESLKQLKQLGHQLYLNSYCGRKRAVESKKVIETEIPGLFDQLFFVRSKKFKGDITEFVGCDIMIDDTLDILINMYDNKTCPNLIWFQGDPTFTDKRKVPKNRNITIAKSWSDVLDFCSKIKPLAKNNPTIDISQKVHIV